MTFDQTIKLIETVGPYLSAVFALFVPSPLFAEMRKKAFQASEISAALNRGLNPPAP